MLDDYLADKSDGTALFALRCQMFREQMSEERNDLLFIPVGHSHQGPILATLAAPARETYLLCSGESWDTGEEIQRTFAGEFSVHLLKINPVDGKEIADKVQAVFETRGCPTRVVCDQTGGQKPTSSTLAGLASLNQWRLLYIDSTNKPKIHGETVRWLPNLFETFGGVERLVARACAETGALVAAEKALDRSLEQAARSAGLLQDRKKLRQARRFRQGQVDAFLRSLENTRWSREKSLARQFPMALAYWMVRCLWKEGQQLAAEGLCMRIWNTAQLKESLARALEQYPREIRSLKDLDKEYGTGFRLR